MTGPPQDGIADLAAIEKRARDLSDWLKKEGRGCFVEQKHLDPDTVERIYWHYGYFAALCDAYRLLTGQQISREVHGSQKRGKDTMYSSV